MKKFKMWVVLSLLFAVLLSGCGEDNNNEITEDNSIEETEEAMSPGTEDIQSSETEAASEQINFTGVDMNGNEVSSSVFSDSKLTMVNVWATYCNPCLSEMPGIGELAGEYEPEEFQVIGIISDVQEGSGQETMELAADLIEQTGADYTHLLLNESIYGELLTDVSAVPTTFFVDKNGEILDTVVGAMEKSAWEEKINELLEK